MLLGEVAPFTSSLANYSFIIFILLVYIWQLVGTLRCVERAIKETGDMMTYWAAYAAIVVVSVLTFLQVFDLSVGPSPQITLESLRTRPLPTLSEDKRRVYLTGDIDHVLSQDLLTLLEQNETLSTVVLESDGGLIYAGRALAYNIQKYHLDTHVDEACSSACTLVFMAGENRTLGEQGEIGFHQYHLERLHPMQVDQITKEQETDRRYFASRGLKHDFLARAYQSNHREIWQPSRVILFEAGVITQP